MPRVRTPKYVAQRIDKDYFKKLRGFRRWKLALSIAVPLIAAGWLFAELVSSKSGVYSSGPVSSAHTVFGQNCALCHVRGASFSAKVDDKACLACHDAPTHNAKQTFTPACSECHLEHKGKFKLGATSEAGCTQCHSHLSVKDGTPKYQVNITGFDGRKHPEFLAMRDGQFDPGTVNLNHHAHLQPTLRGPEGAVQMQCSDCHRPNGINQAWPYALATMQAAGTSSPLTGSAALQFPKRSFAETGAGHYMALIRYADQCAACHTLQFDPFINEPAPHGDTTKIRAFVEAKIKQLIVEHPDLLHRPITAGYGDEIEATRNFLRPTRDYVTLPTQPTTPENWARQRIELAERLLWKKDCKVCHEQTMGEPDNIPAMVKAVIPARWFVHAEFDHQAHRMMKCEACHTGIRESKLTSDRNLPRIKTCQECHKEDGIKVNAAAGQCYECHSYHDWANEKPTKGKFDINTLLSRK
jgi:hypothetical protein